MGVKRKIPPLVETIRSVPPPVLDAIFDQLRMIYAPLLTKERPERINAFLQSRRDHFQEVVLLTSGYEFVVSSPAAAFLRMLDKNSGTLDQHLEESQTQHLAVPYPSWADDKTILDLLRQRRRMRDGAFFRNLAALVEATPEESDFDKFTGSVHSALQDGRAIYRRGEGKVHRGRSYLQILLLAVVEVLIHTRRRLPTVKELRGALKTLMDVPPGKRESMEALEAIGCGPQVLI